MDNFYGSDSAVDDCPGCGLWARRGASSACLGHHFGRDELCLPPQIVELKVVELMTVELKVVELKIAELMRPLHSLSGAMRCESSITACERNAWTLSAAVNTFWLA